MLKIVNITLSIIVIIVLLGLFILKVKDDRLVTTRWYCDQSKNSFISKAYTEYRTFTEHMIFTFSSEDSFMIHEYITVEKNNGNRSPIEVFYEGKYNQRKNELTLKFERVRLLKKYQDSNINKSYQDYQGYSISYAYKQLGNKMYFYSMNKSDVFDMVCYKN
ncbi:hypothetical protein C0W96_09020 [Photobacterium kishitanii]|uniref:hypothetical protein n=1 Tax=Photobacterium kishitanii TaxID=318456 RepID=UPI0005D36ACE|nr:hypothetical protein [Photobacterium kishitanii]KJG10414.1 hypothetical protein UB40_07635 [Photobacterium kishitanii]PSV06194.1 hypothetical protein C0W96_09020 [Photobacterium kishitanii]PSV76520.1 hypothetical protein C0W29_06195 [Photobacterium kishitanii]